MFSLNTWVAIHMMLVTYCPHLGEQALKKTILVNSSSSVVGVVGKKLIHIQHL